MAGVARYTELLDEIVRITEPEGFVDLAREIRDSMLFYDREVLLAIFSGILEGMTISALFLSGLEADERLPETAQRLEEILEELPFRLRNGAEALDVQALFDRFLEVGGRSIQEEFPALVATFRHYFRDEYDLTENPDQLFANSRRLAEALEGDAALEEVGKVGAMILRGRPVHPVWLRIGGPVGPWIHAVFAAGETVASLPGFHSPLLSAREERERRRAWLDRKVVNLSELRQIRRLPETEVEPEDELEGLWTELFSGREKLSPAAAAVLESRGQEILPILETMAAATELWSPNSEGGGLTPVHAVRALIRLKAEQAVGPLLEIVSTADPEEAVFGEAMDGLATLAPRARREILSYATREADLETAVFLSEILARGRRDERVFKFLTNLFRQATWLDGKEVVADSLAEYGDRRALPLLEEALQEGVGRDAYQEEELRRAIEKLKAKAWKNR